MTLWLVVAVSLLAAGAAPRRLGSAAPQADTNSLEAAPPPAAPRLPPTPPPAEDDDGDDDEDTKTLSQQIADGKYGLIQKELYREAPARPGIVSYAANPEVPRDTARTLGGLRPSEVWLAEDHVLVLRGGAFAAPERADQPPWPPIDDYHAPPRQVRLPARPRVPPPFPVQLADGEPPRLLGNQSRARPPFFAPPFPFPGPGAANATQDGAAPPYLYPPPGNFPSGGAFPAPAGNGSLSPPPYPFPPPRNGSLYGPPAGPFPPFYFPGPYGPPPTGNATYPLPFPPPGNGTFPFPFPPPGNGTLPFPFPFPVNGSLPPGFPALPPGAALLPPPGFFNDTFDEDDMSIYYPPPYDFYYPTDNTTQVPPGPLVPGIVLPPPPNFFGPLDNETKTAGSGVTTVAPPPSETTTRKGYTAKYVPVTTQNRRKKPTPSTTPEPVAGNPASTTPPPPPTPATPVPPGRSPSVQVIHDGASPLRPPNYYYYDVPVTSTVAPPTVVLSSTTAVPPPASVSYVVVPVTDIVVRQPTQSRQQQRQQQQQQQQQQQRPKAPDPTPHTYFYDPVSDRSPKKSYYFFEEPWRGLSFQFPVPSPTLQTLLGQSYRQPTQLYYYSDTSKRQRPSQSVSNSHPVYYRQPQQSSTVPPPSLYYPQSTPGQISYYSSTTPTPVPYYYQVSTHSYYDIGPSTARPVYQYNFERNQVPNTTPRSHTSPSTYQTTPRTVFEFSYRQQQKFQQPPSYFTGGHTPTDFSQVHITTRAPSQSQQYRGQQILGSGYSTENPLSALFTRQDESLLDENTKRYFTIFGQKLPQQESEIPSTTPMPSPKEQQNVREPLPLSLEGDTLVNYRPPLPAANPDSEFIAYPLPGDGAHAYFLPPGGGYSYPAPVPNQRLRYRRKDTGSEVT